MSFSSNDDVAASKLRSVVYEPRVLDIDQNQVPIYETKSVPYYADIFVHDWNHMPIYSPLSLPYNVNDPFKACHVNLPYPLNNRMPRDSFLPSVPLPHNVYDAHDLHRRDWFRDYDMPSTNALLSVPINLYDVFLDCIHEESKNQVSLSDLNNAMIEIHTKYSPRGLQKANSLDYNRIALRCGYVYLYCTSHSRMVQQAFEDLYTSKPNYFNEFLKNQKDIDEELRVCSIGGGPGSDVVGTLLFLKQFEIFENDGMAVKISLVDGYAEWASTFATIVTNFNQRKLFPPRNSAKVLFQDLLKELSPYAKLAIEQANIITMVKFVSAICGDIKKARRLLKDIFDSMSVGSIILIIDNSGGRAFDETLKMAESRGLSPIIPAERSFPFKVDKFLEPNIQFRQFEKSSQRTVKVSVVFMEKMYNCTERGVKRSDSSNNSVVEENETKRETIKKRKLDEDFNSFSPYRTPSKRSRLVEEVDDKCGKIVLSRSPRPSSRISKDKSESKEQSRVSDKNSEPNAVKTYDLKPLSFNPTTRNYSHVSLDFTSDVNCDNFSLLSSPFNFNPENFNFGPQPNPNEVFQFGSANQ